MIKQFPSASTWSEDAYNLLPFYRYVPGIEVSMESQGFILRGGGRPDAPAPRTSRS